MGELIFGEIQALTRPASRHDGATMCGPHGRPVAGLRARALYPQEKCRLKVHAWARRNQAILGG